MPFEVKKELVHGETDPTHECVSYVKTKQAATTLSWIPFPTLTKASVGNSALDIMLAGEATATAAAELVPRAISTSRPINVDSRMPTDA